jgi:coenzyme F420-0:L-glutamate ligase/coenzyme F420-1:gamma-L-glutamate ligase
MRVEILGIKEIPLIGKEDDLGEIIFMAAEKQGIKIKNGDILVVTQKIVSKAEGKLIALDLVNPTEEANQIADITGKDPRIIQIVLNETKNVIRLNERAIISETHHGFICANAGVDYSNIEDGYVAVLPENPDRSASMIRSRIRGIAGIDIAVIITDTWGRPWRLGQVDFAIGISGISPFKDYRGEQDLMGHTLSVTNIAIVDEIAAAAELVKGKELGIPAVIIRGYEYEKTESSAITLLRSIDQDLFR